jgi:hypothetical protein
MKGKKWEHGRLLLASWQGDFVSRRIARRIARVP